MKTEIRNPRRMGQVYDKMHLVMEWCYIMYHIKIMIQECVKAMHV